MHKAGVGKLKFLHVLYLGALIVKNSSYWKCRTTKFEVSTQCACSRKYNAEVNCVGILSLKASEIWALMYHITFLDTVLGTTDFFCDGGGLEYISCLFRAVISASSFSSSFPVSPRRVFCGLLVGGWEQHYIIKKHKPPVEFHQMNTFCKLVNKCFFGKQSITKLFLFATLVLRDCLPH